MRDVTLLMRCILINYMESTSVILKNIMSLKNCSDKPKPMALLFSIHNPSNISYFYKSQSPISMIYTNNFNMWGTCLLRPIKMYLHNSSCCEYVFCIKRSQSPSELYQQNRLHETTTQLAVILSCCGRNFWL